MNPDRRRALQHTVRLGTAAAFPLAAQGNPTSTPATPSRLLRVGPAFDLKTPSQASRVAQDGDTIEIEPGVYRGDVAVWPQSRLSLRARIPGTVRLLAEGASAEEKAIWVLRQGSFEISGIAFEGARVVHANGAGIRFERGALQLSGCRFADNEMGLLTGNDPASRLTVTDCEFAGRRQGPRFGHNLYVGCIGHFSVTDSWFHTAFQGHLLKTRARVSEVIGNRLIDGPDGQASYELEFPDGGDVLAQSNRIVQGAGTRNSVMVSYGVEGYPHPVNRLRLLGNTLQNLAPQGVFVRVSPGAVQVTLLDNRFEGPGGFEGVSP